MGEGEPEEQDNAAMGEGEEPVEEELSAQTTYFAVSIAAVAFAVTAGLYRRHRIKTLEASYDDKRTPFARSSEAIV